MGEKSDKQFYFGESEEPHEIGNPDCDTCHGGTRPCECGGLIHTEYMDEDWDNVFLYYSCDKCGEDYREAY